MSNQGDLGQDSCPSGQLPIRQITMLVGTIVLETQLLEKQLKFLLPFTDSSDPELSAVLARHGKLAKLPLGELNRQLQDVSTGDQGFLDYLDSVVARRNRVVHHFADTYGPRLQAGKTREVFEELKGLLNDVRVARVEFQRATRDLAGQLVEFVFAGTPEEEGLSALCDQLRTTPGPQ